MIVVLTEATTFIVGSYQSALLQTSSGSNIAFFNSLQTVIEVVEIVGC